MGFITLMLIFKNFNAQAFCEDAEDHFYAPFFMYADYLSQGST